MLEHRVARPRLLVDGGATIFHCLVHRNCHLTENAKEILTNNLFVAQALCVPKVRLISGEWDVRTGSLVNCTDKPARLEQFLLAHQRRPDVALMSFDCIWGSTSRGNERSQGGDVALYSEDGREAQLKLAAFGATKLAVFIVIEGANICRLPSAEVPVCTVAQLIAWQMKAQFATRDVCIITDLERPSHEQAHVINALSGKQLRDHRIWLVTPEIDTRPSSR
jgi:hypothetical protein